MHFFHSIGRRVGAGFAAIVLLLLLLGAFSVLQLMRIQDAVALLSEEALPGYSAVMEVQSRLKENFGLAQAEFHTRQPARLATRISENVRTIDQLMQGYEARLKEPENRRLFASFAVSRAAWVTAFGAMLTSSRAGQTQAALTQLEAAVLPAFDQVHRDLQALADFDHARMLAAKDVAARSAALGARTIKPTLLGAAVLAALLAWWIGRSVARSLLASADALVAASTQNAAAAGQVSVTSQSLASGASEQAASLEETSSSLEEMAGLTKRNSGSARRASELSREASAKAAEGVGDMQAMATAIAEMKASSDDIAKIIRTIDEIAFQTNILALNAAVEAARAGDAGTGFAVVADEVRGLARRSAEAARETAARIESAIGRTASGVELSDRVTGSLRGIVAKVQEVDTLVAEVASASEDQTRRIEQVNAAIGQIDQVTQGNAASAEESASAAEELSAQTMELKALVGQLLQLAGGRRENDPRGLSGASRGDGRRRGDAAGVEAKASARAVRAGSGRTFARPAPVPPDFVGG